VVEADGQADGAKTIDLGLRAVQAPPRLGTPDTTVVTIGDVDKAGQVQFGQAAYSVTESQGRALIEVSRTGGLAGPATVHFTARVGAVSPARPEDFDAVSGTLTFGRGEKSKTLRVAVRDDATPDAGAVSVDLSLDSPGGGLRLGEISLTTLWIVRE
jgi:hypothetical protein